MAAAAPRNGQARVVGVARGVRLVLNARLVQVVAADGARVGADLWEGVSGATGFAAGVPAGLNAGTARVHNRMLINALFHLPPTTTWRRRTTS